MGYAIQEGSGMKKVIMTLGLPASGKTTWAKALILDSPGVYKRVNKDDLRSMLDVGKYSSDNEKFILAIRDSIIAAALDAGKHVIVDDTNLAPKHKARLLQVAQQRGAEFEVKDFTGVSLDVCLERDRKRANYCGEKVIRDMHRQFLAAKIVPPPHVSSWPSCVIVDIDGTLALKGDRSPYEWKRVGEDLLNEPVAEAVYAIETAQVIFVSGRDECCRAETDAWLHDHFLVTGELKLFMRPAGDMRDDRIIKREIYEREILGKYNVNFVLDDRDKVVRMWRDLGLTCFQVADGDF